MRIEADLQYHPKSFLPHLTTCQIEKVVELPDEEFSELLQYPMKEHRFIAENLSCIVDRGSVIHSLMALGQGRNDGVIIAAEGRARAEYAAYLPEARSIINRELDRAAEFIIQHGTEHTGTRSRCVCFEELQEHLGLNIQEGNGLDAMLKSALERRPGIALVEMCNSCITTEYRPEFCRQLMTISSGMEEVRAAENRPFIQYPQLQGSRPLEAEDLDIQERIGAENGWLSFCLDILAEEEAVFGRQLSNEDEDAYVQAYTSLNEHTGEVDDTLDIVVRSPGGDEWFSCALTPETRSALREKMDVFCAAQYGEHLPERSMDECAPAQPVLSM